MGGKTSTSTSQVQIPPEVLARYNSVNATAQNVAQTPFQQYSTNPNAFVAPLTPTQTAGVQNTNAAAGMAQPYFDAATGFALAGSQPINAQPLDTSAYMNPYLQTVLGSTEAMVNQQNQQAMAGQTGSAINQGYFGGDRSGIAAAVLQGQQQLTGGQLYSGIASDAYQQALAAAQQQQGVQLGAAQANRQALTGAGEQLAGIGTGAQGAALSGAQAQLGAGQVEQQTEQAGKTALYNQFLQQQSYPFQTAQFLANIAEGTGALSGNTTTATQPGGLFSDERLKEGMEPIGTGFDGANIYRFRYKGDPTTRIGMSAQEVERKHPEAVGERAGFKTVDYGRATDDAARTGFALAANDNFDDEQPRQARQAGGMSGWGQYPPGVNPMSLGELLQAQEQMYGPGFGGAGLYGGSSSGMPHGGSSYVPAPMQGQPMMIHGTQPPMPPRTTAADALHSAAGLSGDVTGLRDDVKDVQGGWNWLNQNVGSGSVGGSGAPFDASVAARRAATMREPDPSGADNPLFARGGFARAHRQDGGDISSPQDDNPYQAHGGPGLNIPTAETQHPQLQAAKPPQQQGGSGLMSALGAGADVASIAKAAPEIGAMASGIGSGIAGAGSTLMSLLPFLALKRGGRAGFAAGGDAVEEALKGAEPSGDDPVENMLLSRFQKQQADAPGFAAADTSKPADDAVAGGAGAPAAGFADAERPGAPAAAAGTKPGGFAGAAPIGLPAGFAGIYKAEGTGKNPASSAVGPGQFIRSTFIRTARKTFPELADMSDDAIGALHGTAKGNEMQAQMIPVLDAENQSALQAAGFPPTPTNRHLAWVLGPAGAKKVLGADPATPLSQLLSGQALAANQRIMAGKTAGDFIGWAAKGMNKGGRVGFQDGGDPRFDPSRMEDAEPNPTPQDIAANDAEKAGFDPDVVAAARAAAHQPEVVAQAVKNRSDAAQGLPSTPAAQAAAAGDAPAPVSARAPPPPPPDGGAAPAAPVTGNKDFSAADQSTAPKPTLNDTVNAGLKYGEGAYAQATQQAQRVVGGQEAPKPFWKNPDFLIPAATGIADMLAAPTKYPLVALTQGLKGGAQAYQGMRQYDATQALSEQERTALGLGETTQAFTGQTGRMTAQNQAFLNSMTYLQTRFTPVAQLGEDHLPGYRDNMSGAFVPASQYARISQQAMSGAITGFGGGNPMAGAVAGSMPGAFPSAPPSTGSVSGNPPGAMAPSAPGNASPGSPAGSPDSTAGPPPPVGPQAVHDGSGRGDGVPPPIAQATPAATAQHVGPNFAMKDRVASGEFRQQPITYPTVDTSQLTPDTNPDQLMTDGRALVNMGTPAQVTAGQQKIDQANRYYDGVDLPTLKGSNQPYEGYRQLAQANERSKTVSANYAQERANTDRDAGAFAKGSQEEGQVYNHLIQTYQDWDTNRLSGDFANLIGAAKTVPYLNHLLTPDMLKALNSSDEATKQTARLQFLQAAGSALGEHAPATTLGVVGKALPGPDKGAGARWDLAAQAIALRNQTRAFYRSWARDKTGVDDVAGYKSAWFQANPITKFESPVYDAITPFAGVPHDQMMQHPRHPKSMDEAGKIRSGVPYEVPGHPGVIYEN